MPTADPATKDFGSQTSSSSAQVLCTWKSLVTDLVLWLSFDFEFPLAFPKIWGGQTGRLNLFFFCFVSSFVLHIARGSFLEISFLRLRSSFVYSSLVVSSSCPPSFSLGRFPRRMFKSLMKCHARAGFNSPRGGSRSRHDDTPANSPTVSDLPK